ncbi:MAG: transcriptional regulator [Candidatus Lokiarchaeota archaeon]|nr:transcriptional regulator [Candidatus Lokiarchaeota archaeon]
MHISNKDKVIEAFKKAKKPLCPGVIAKETGIDSKKVSKIIKELHEEGKAHSLKKCSYALK